MSQIETIRHVDRSGRIYGFELDGGNNVFILYRASASSTLWQPAISMPVPVLTKLHEQVRARFNRDTHLPYADNVGLD